MREMLVIANVTRIPCASKKFFGIVQCNAARTLSNAVEGRPGNQIAGPDMGFQTLIPTFVA